MRQADNAVGR